MLMGAAPLVLGTQIMPYFVSIYFLQCFVSESVPFYNLKGLLDRDDQPKAAFEKVKTIYHIQK